jgi:L-lactate dehydrogenase complex protein LldF
MCLSLPETLISVVGIEKVLPTAADLDVFLQLLPRSSTGERMNPYTSMWTGVTPGDGPQVVHVVLLDNGRTNALADEVGRQALRCIRCSACLNVCPVYERVGGHAYGSVYPGPIGAVLNPQLRGTSGPSAAVDASLPYASSLCGACFDACPVLIDIPEILVHLRARVVEEKRDSRRLPGAEDLAMKGVAWTLSDPARLERAQRGAAFSGRLLAFLGKGDNLGRIPGLSAWSDARDTPAPPAESFRDWWRRRAESDGAEQ